MSKLSLYETKWTDLVFENKNKEYGAYQLRQENPKTTVTALFMGLLLITALGSVPVLISKFTTPNVVQEPIPLDSEPLTPVDLSNEIVQPKTEEVAPPPAQQAATTDVIETKQLVDPLIVPENQATPDIAKNTDNVVPLSNTGNGDGNVKNAIPSDGNGDGVLNGTGDKPEILTPVPTSALDKLPEFPGGIEKFYTYVGRNFNRPELDVEKTLKVYVSFVIEKDGSLTDIIVRNDPGYGMGKEAIRVLKSLKTKWVPGMVDGKAVRTAYSLPITVKTEIE
ncbi:energy transducer TonB [Flavobacterium foetidum]|uniref:energy transducer TonB n=1 Tax=Flavobacterium foetidum TaxID=2026681 RepID=UPI0010754313|nr:energy transducer TonB [Flavobacterium foetidum]KAF2514205.1 energy transducer TonB [Flavobacterium foetidum]